MIRTTVAAYDAGFRATMTVEDVDSLPELLAAAAALDGPAARLFDLLVTITVPGELLPDRLKPTIAKLGEPLWRAGLLIPRTAQSAGVIPLHYAGACRINPTLRTWEPPWWSQPRPDAQASPPPADAARDAIVLAVLLEQNPAPLNQGGTLRKDVEKRLLQGYPGDIPRWSLALAFARANGLIRVNGLTLQGYPESNPRPVQDIATLLPDRLTAMAASLLLRLVGPDWLDLGALINELRARCPEILRSPPGSDWDAVEAVAFATAADVLHRIGRLDAARRDGHIVALRQPQPVTYDAGMLVTPDLTILVHPRGLSLRDYARLARLAPYQGGDVLYHHRISREGVASDLGTGHQDPLGFLAAHSRTGVPANVRDAVSDWLRANSRLVIETGVELIEENGALRFHTGPPPPDARIIDYTTPPRARFTYHHGRITVPMGLDPLPLRALVSRVATFEAETAEGWVYKPTLQRNKERDNKEPATLIAALSDAYGGTLPGELEAMILAGHGVPPVVVIPSVLLRLPPEIADALRRDRVLSPLFRSLTQTEIIVQPEDLSTIRARLNELGVGLT